MGLEEIRKELDTIDREIVQLFQKRMDLSIEVAKDKAKTGKAVFDGKREEEKLNSISDMVGDPLLKTPARELFRGLMTLSRRRQLQYLSEIGHKSDFSFREVGELSFSGKKLAAQGVKWSYSYLRICRAFSGRVGGCPIRKGGLRNPPHGQFHLWHGAGQL